MLEDMLVTGDKRFLGNVTVDGNLDVRGLSNLDGTVFIGGGYKQHDATGGTSSKGTTITDAGIISASGTATIAGSVSIGGGFGQSGTTITDAGRISTDGIVEIGGGYAGVGNGDTGITITDAGVISTSSTLYVHKTSTLSGSVSIGGGYDGGSTGVTITDGGTLSAGNVSIGDLTVD